MNPQAKIALAGAATVVIIVGGLVLTKVDNWFSNEPTGPGSGDEVDRGNGPGEPGPGSGEEVISGDPNYDPSLQEPAGPGSGDEVTTDELIGPGSGDEVSNGPGSGEENNAIGSCNVIGFGSTCIDYIGSYWKNIDFSKMNCSGEGIWSENPCPTNYMGGCDMNSGNQYELITWHYNYGGDPFDQELTGYAAQACNINPYGTWILGN